MLSMNAPISRSLTALVATGALAILLLGAFSHINPPAAAPPTLPTGSPADLAIESAGGPELPANLSPGLAEIIRMAQARVDESVILEFIRNSGQAYAPTADELLYLSDLGLSQTVLAALFKDKPPAANKIASADPIPAAPSPDATPASQGANSNLFYNALAPYGSWLQLPDYGLCWQPTTETVNPDWRPYVDEGQWLYTADNGWYWQSGYSWGWAAFHYGRWSKNARFGWVWVPDKVWGPAWVSWRIALSYAGWAPLPPGVRLNAAGSLTYNNRLVAADFDFGLPAGTFTFVSEANFLNLNLPGYAMPASQVVVIYNKSVAANNYSIAHKKILNLGPGWAGIAAAAGAEAGPLLVDNKVAPKDLLPDSAPPIAPANATGPSVVVLSRGEAARSLAIPRQSSDLPVLTQLQPAKVNHHHWEPKYPSFSNDAVAAHSGPPATTNSSIATRLPSLPPRFHRRNRRV